MKQNTEDACAPTRRVIEVAPRAGDRTLREGPEGPAILTHGEGRVLFGPGIDDFNAFDDPC